MKNGIWCDDEGFHVMVDGVDRVFSDNYDGALALARNLKRTNRPSRIEIRTMAQCAKCWKTAGLGDLTTQGTRTFITALACMGKEPVTPPKPPMEDPQPD